MELLLALALAAAPVGPSGIPLERLVDTTTQLPGTTGPVFFDGVPPFPCGNSVIFRASEAGASGSWAYSASTTGIEVVVDEETTVADHTFSFVSEFRCIAPDHLAFLGEEAPPSTSLSSAYEWHRGQPLALLQSPGVDVGGHTLGPLSRLSANHDGLGILALLDPVSKGQVLAVKPFNEPLQFVADWDTVLPGQTMPSTIYSLPLIVDDNFAFRARTFLDVGLYQWTPTGTISVLAVRAQVLLQHHPRQVHVALQW